MSSHFVFTPLFAETPGVGSYQPKMSAVERNTGNTGAAMRGQETRFKSDVAPTDDNLGPGAYTPEVHATGGRATLASRSSKSAAAGGSAVFSSDVTRDLY